MLSWLIILITISILFSMYPELKIKNCKKKSSTYAFYFYSPSYYSIHYLQIIIAIFRKNYTGRHFQNGRHNAAQVQHCSISTSWIDSRHRKISTGRHFQNGRLQYIIYRLLLPYFRFSNPDIKTEQDMIIIQRLWSLPIRPLTTGLKNILKATFEIEQFLSSKFYMWVDNDVPTLNNFYMSPFSKWSPQYRKNLTLSDIKIWYVGR
jgi:hypothetical protein